ncbi:hypothetical protein IAE22_28975, partial [Bacillus sp. S34]|nr:hypothetical protein [Bacillus sp. S34]
TLDIDANAQQKQVLNTYDNKAETAFKLGAALDSVEVGSGRILTMAQNKDYDQSLKSPPTSTSINYSVDKKYGGGIGFQVGSTYKVFTLLDWLKAGHGLNEVVNGTPHNTPVWQHCGEPTYTNWAPKNDSAGEKGNFTVIAATAASVNAAFARRLAAVRQDGHHRRRRPDLARRWQQPRRHCVLAGQHRRWQEQPPSLQQRCERYVRGVPCLRVAEGADAAERPVPGRSVHRPGP